MKTIKYTDYKNLIYKDYSPNIAATSILIDYLDQHYSNYDFKEELVFSVTNESTSYYKIKSRKAKTYEEATIDEHTIRRCKSLTKGNTCMLVNLYEDDQCLIFWNIEDYTRTEIDSRPKETFGDKKLVDKKQYYYNIKKGLRVNFKIKQDKDKYYIEFSDINYNLNTESITLF